MESKQHNIALVINEENSKFVEGTVRSTMDGSAPKKNQGFKRPLPSIPKDPAAKKVKVEAQPCVDVKERKPAIPDSSGVDHSVCPRPQNAIIEDHQTGDKKLVEEKNRKLIEETDLSAMEESDTKPNQGFKRPLPFIPKDSAAKKVKIELAQPCADVKERKQMSTTIYSEEELRNVCKQVEDMAARIHLVGRIVIRAKGYFKQMQDGKFMKGRCHNGIAAACLYIACNKEGVSRTHEEISRASVTISVETIRSNVNFVTKTLNILLDSIRASDFVPRFCSNLGLPFAVQKTAAYIARNVMDLKIVSPGQSPISVAGAAIYMACQASEDKYKRTLKVVAERIAGATDVTIRKNYKVMIQHPNAEQLFPDGFLFFTPINRLPTHSKQ